MDCTVQGCYPKSSGAAFQAAACGILWETRGICSSVQGGNQVTFGVAHTDMGTVPSERGLLRVFNGYPLESLRGKEASGTQVG